MNTVAGDPSSLLVMNDEFAAQSDAEQQSPVPLNSEIARHCLMPCLATRDRR